MQKHIMLGVDPIRQYCCILKCLLPFSALKPDEIEASDFSYTCTNWGGADRIQRTLDIEHLTRTGRVIRLNNPIQFSGVDFDMGHQYPFSFEFTEIHETQET